MLRVSLPGTNNTKYTKAFTLALLFLLIWALLSTIIFFAWVHGADHRDFYPRWAGSRLALFQRRDLYAEETTQLMQIELYGRPLPAERDQQGFAYPAQLVVVLLPFWLIGNVEIATSAWTGLSILIMLLTLYLLRDIWGTPPRWAIAALFFWYFPLLMIFQAQITTVPMAAIGIGYWAYRNRHDTFAGVILSLGIVKPDLVLIPTALFLILAIRSRRWRFLTGFGFAQIILLVASVAVAGWWLPGWVQALHRYAGYAKVSWPPRAAWAIHPLLFFGLLAFTATALKRTRWTEPAALAISIPLGMLLLPQTLLWGLTMLTIPFTVAWIGRARWAVAGTWLLGWLLILGSSQPNWWRYQNLLMPVLATAVISLASRQDSNPVRSLDI